MTLETLAWGGALAVLSCLCLWSLQGMCFFNENEELQSGGLTSDALYICETLGGRDLDLVG